MKTKKALAKRIKITSRNKILKRPPHQNHFNARLAGNAKRARHGNVTAPRELTSLAKALIS